jgi:RhtB (resistance to homoserine/threonine) family protein
MSGRKRTFSSILPLLLEVCFIILQLKKGGGCMFGIVHFEVFLLTAILLNLTPGMDTMFIISKSISKGRAAGIYSALGITTGSIVHTLLAAFGLSVLLMKSVLLFQLVKIIGAGYLVYLGIQMLRSKGASFQLDATSDETPGKIYRQGMITNITNPKVALFFLAFLPQFMDTQAASPLPFIVLGCTFALTGCIWCCIVAVFSSFFTKKLRENEKVNVRLNQLTGVLFIGMGLKLLTTKSSQ